MQYLGGKARIAKALTAFLESRRKPGQLYVEPFLGGCNVLPLMSGERWGNEINPDLIMLYNAVRDGWEPPGFISEDEYKALRHAPSSPLRGFAGIACSYGGKWWGGYAKDGKGRNYCSNGKNAIVRLGPKIQNVKFTSLDYREMQIPDGALVYCDPPYAKTTGYKQAGAFDSEAFWQWAAELSTRCDVYVSEYEAPDGWEVVWEKHRNLELRRGTKETTKKTQTERLFRHA